MIARIRLGLRNISDRDLLKKARAVLQGMKDNPKFLEPWVTMPTYERSIDDFENALDNQPNSGIYGTADKNAKRHLVITQYRNLSYYVQHLAEDWDHALITEAGFETKKSGAPQPMPKGIIRRIENAGTGVLLVRAEIIPNAASYCLRWVLVADDGKLPEWPDRPESFVNSRMRIEGLIPGKVYAFQVCGIGALGPGDWSDPVQHRSL